MFSGHNPYVTGHFFTPPFSALVFYPLTHLSKNAAYCVQVLLLCTCNIASLALLAWLMQRITRTVIYGQISVIPLVFITVVTLQFFGYPFEFSLERGNYDAFALLSIVLGLWFASQKGKNIWLSILFFSMAAHLKIYPGVLLLIPLWQHRWRALAPLALVNSVLLFAFGFRRATEFLVGLRLYATQPSLWSCNHSAVNYSNQFFEKYMQGSLPHPFVHQTVMTVLLGAPLAIWLHGSIRLMKGGFNEQAMLLWAALSTPVMCIIPSTSYDYKLIICALPATVCLTQFAINFVSNGGWIAFFATVVTLAAMVLIARSVLYPPIFGVGNKYPVLILLEVCAYLAIWMKTSNNPRVNPVLQ
jgi:hypothetical protein